MLEDYKEIYEEREEQNYDEYENIKMRNEFYLTSINFDETIKNLEKDREKRENEADNKDNISTDKIIFDLKVDMRKELYDLIDYSNKRNDPINLIGKKRSQNNYFHKNFPKEHFKNNNI